MSKYDLTTFVLNSFYQSNSAMTDDKGLPSVMVYIPKFKMSDVIDGGSDAVHPAFIVDGVERDGIYIAKYQNTVHEERAYSLPGEDPAIEVDFDTASLYCTAKGARWHMMTAMEWGAIALWCKKNGTLPYGNNSHGKDFRESSVKAIPAGTDGSGNITRVATGTGPLSWSHNRQLGGIFDLNGNVCELLGGLRLVFGELQILENNNAASQANSQGASSPAWKAIDGTTGALVTPNGAGTTENSIKLDYIDQKWKFVTGDISNAINYDASCAFASLSCADTICDAAKELLIALAVLPDDSTYDYQGSFFGDNSGAEVIMARGGTHSNSSDAGLFNANWTLTRSEMNEFIGFRSAYYTITSQV